MVIPSTVACGSCSYCRAGYFAQCDKANPDGPGTAFFGGPKQASGFAGLQAERARIPYANVGLVKLPDEVSDDQAIMISDIFPTGYFGADLADIHPGATVAVFGCGPVGLFAILSAQLLGAGRVLAVDRIEDRLQMARQLGAEVINFEAEDPVETLKRLTGGIGPDRIIDAVGVDANTASWDGADSGPDFDSERDQVAPETNRDGVNWIPGDAPSEVLRWAVEAVAKAGTISIVGVYPPQMDTFPIGAAMNKNLTIKSGNCNHRKYIPYLVELTRTGAVDPRTVLSELEGITNAVDAYRAFDERRPGWLKVELEPTS